MTLHIDEANTRVVLTTYREDSPVFGDAHATFVLPVAVADTQQQPRALQVELLRVAGGQMPRALIGATFTPSQTASMRVDVALTSAHLLEDWNMSLATAFGPHASELAPGIPLEYGPAILRAFLAVRPVPGFFEVNFGGYDPVESSGRAFEIATTVLFLGLLHAQLGDAEAPIRKLLASAHS